MDNPLFPANTDGDELLARLRSFKSDYFPLHQQRFQDLVRRASVPKRCSSAARIRAWCLTC